MTGNDSSRIPNEEPELALNTPLISIGECQLKMVEERVGQSMNDEFLV
jgi:hypothetical protein